MKVFDKAAVGFNHNLSYKGGSYHIQTEDSGANNPHIITHLFQGGTIIATRKRNYAQEVGRPDLKQYVRALMEEQQKEMQRELLSGAFDAPSATSAGKAGAAKGGATPPTAHAAQARETSAKKADGSTSKSAEPQLEEFPGFGSDPIGRLTLDALILEYIEGKREG